MAKVKFAEDYDHTWPSRAVTAYKAGWSGTVKREVADRAERLGKLDTREEAEPPAEETADHETEAQGDATLPNDTHSD